MPEKCFSVEDPQPLRRAGAKRGPHPPKQRPLDSKTSTSTSNEVFSKLSSAHAWASVIFGGWGEGDVIAVVILLRVSARMSW